MASVKSEGTTYEFLLVGVDIDLMTDPATGLVYGPPTAIECIGAGEFLFRCVGDDASVARRFTGVTSGSGFQGTCISTALAGSTCTALRVRWGCNRG